MKRKILYLSNIPWDWIYQRPQTIAEALRDTGNEITYVYQRLPFGKRHEEVEGITFRSYVYIPFIDRFKPFELMYKVLNKARTFFDINKYDVVYVCHPLYEAFIPSDYKGKIIYDCMDNHSAMCSRIHQARYFDSLERVLCRKSDAILASSNALIEKIMMYDEKLQCQLVRNGYNANEMLQDIKCSENKNTYKAAYIGTIASWFDFELLKSAGAEIKNVKYDLIGPADVIDNSEMFTYVGVVDHDSLFKQITDVDCLVMPFVLNDVVTAVDPVKLYEYISFGKCIVSVCYKEIERFADFVYFYNTRDEYVALMKDLTAKGFPTKYDDWQRSQFLKENSWDKRIEIIYRCLGE